MDLRYDDPALTMRHADRTGASPDTLKACFIHLHVVENTMYSENVSIPLTEH